MKNKVKKYLKSNGIFKNKDKIKEIIKHPDLTEDEKWIIYYTFGEDRMVINTCLKLNICERRYYLMKDQALIKLYYILHL